MGDYRFAKGNNPNGISRKSQRAYRPFERGENLEKKIKETPKTEPVREVYKKFYAFYHNLSERQQKFFSRLGGRNLKYQSPLATLIEEIPLMKSIFTDAKELRNEELLFSLYQHIVRYVFLLDEVTEKPALKRNISSGGYDSEKLEELKEDAESLIGQIENRNF
ncbi:MAG: hypothetical protein Q8R00_00385 [Candidatus Nanoarchaeia archaeon]|nr:hypothetical protein [Candidatus Nanoarchaeia archaeon]